MSTHSLTVFFPLLLLQVSVLQVLACMPNRDEPMQSNRWQFHKWAVAQPLTWWDQLFTQLHQAAKADSSSSSTGIAAADVVVTAVQKPIFQLQQATRSVATTCQWLARKGPWPVTADGGQQGGGVSVSSRTFLPVHAQTQAHSGMDQGKAMVRREHMSVAAAAEAGTKVEGAAVVAGTTAAAAGGTGMAGAPAAPTAVEDVGMVAESVASGALAAAEAAGTAAAVAAPEGPAEAPAAATAIAAAAVVVSTLEMQLPCWRPELLAVLVPASRPERDMLCDLVAVASYTQEFLLQTIIMLHVSYQHEQQWKGTVPTKQQQEQRCQQAVMLRRRLNEDVKLSSSGGRDHGTSDSSGSSPAGGNSSSNSSRDSTSTTTSTSSSNSSSNSSNSNSNSTIAGLTSLLGSEELLWCDLAFVRSLPWELTQNVASAVLPPAMTLAEALVLPAYALCNSSSPQQLLLPDEVAPAPAPPGIISRSSDLPSIQVGGSMSSMAALIGATRRVYSPASSIRLGTVLGTTLPVSLPNQWPAATSSTSSRSISSEELMLFIVPEDVLSACMHAKNASLLGGGLSDGLSSYVGCGITVTALQVEQILWEAFFVRLRLLGTSTAESAAAIWPHATLASAAMHAATAGQVLPPFTDLDKAAAEAAELVVKHLPAALYQMVLLTSIPGTNNVLKASTETTTAAAAAEPAAAAAADEDSTTAAATGTGSSYRSLHISLEVSPVSEAFSKEVFGEEAPFTLVVPERCRGLAMQLQVQLETSFDGCVMALGFLAQIGCTDVDR